MAGEDKPKKDTKSSNQTPAWENSNHALYLHHSDQPGTVLVSQALEEDNYVEWKQSMTSALTNKNKIGFVNGTLPMPQFNEEEKMQWTRCNALVKNWLENSMSKQIRKSVVHCKDVRSVWLELQERFSQTNTVNLFNIETAIHECVQEGNSVTSFFTNLKALWDEKDALCTSTLCTCAAATEAATALETHRTMKFLMGLNDDYAAVRSTIIGIDPLPTLNKAYAMVLRQEKQAAVSGNKGSSSTEAAVFYSKKENRETWKKNSNKIDGLNSNKIDGSRCAKCGRTNHITKNCRAHLTCTFCTFTGHTQDECRKRKAVLHAAGENSSQASSNLAKCGRTNHTTKNCKAHLTCTFCTFTGHTQDECRKRKAVLRAAGEN